MFDTDVTKKIIKDTSPLIYARVAGILYLTMVPLGFFGMYGHSSLIVSC